ncbi:hypothetical protein DER44DRAFT_801769 [Fusarium oxysporum]|nr:hypothetical protein DER44DRAFT_801769 [Fusarium oxysporum]
MGRRRAFTNPSNVESERERARNRRCRQQQRHQSLVRQEGSAYPGIRVINSVHGQVPPEDASRNSLMHTGTATTLPAYQTVPQLRPWIVSIHIYSLLR